MRGPRSGHRARAAARRRWSPASSRKAATAFYEGLRFGELRALRWEDIDLSSGTISVVRSWDEKEGVVGPKSIAGTRRVPIPNVLREEIERTREQRLWDEGLAFGRTEPTPFGSTGVYKRAREVADQA